MVVSSAGKYLIQRLADVRASLKEGDGWSEQDIVDVALEVSEYVRLALDVPRLEAELLARANVDVAALREAVTTVSDAVEKDPSQFGVTFGDDSAYDWKEKLERLGDFVVGLGTPHLLEELEVLLRLGLIGDPGFGGLLLCASDETGLHGWFEAKLRKKLNLLKDESKVLELWSYLRAEVDPSVDGHLDIDVGVVTPKFFDIGDADDARDKVAKYLAQIRPRLTRRMIQRGKTRFIGTYVGIATILSWTTTPTTRVVSRADGMAIRAIGRLSLCWQDDNTELAAALGVQSKGYLVGGRGETDAKRALSGNDEAAPSPSPVRMLDELVKLVRIADARAGSPDAPVERALIAHKLGLELVCQDVRAEMMAWNELRLQRALCRFMLERDVRAYGTAFGRSEIDLRTEDAYGAVVIEAKKVMAVPSTATLNKWLTQLGSYMDQEHLAARGVLVLYNFTNVPILAPKETIRYRYLVLVANLCPDSPSKRRASITVVEGDESPVRVVTIGSSEVSSKTTKKKTTTTARKKQAPAKKRARGGR